MREFLPWCVAGFLLAVAAVHAQGDGSLQGTWIAVAAQRDGKAADDVKGHVVQFTGDRFEISLKGKSLYQGKYEVNAAKTPATIDFIHMEGKLAGRRWLGIFEVSKDTLKICDNAPNIDGTRPEKFAATAGSGHVFVTLKREK